MLELEWLCKECWSIEYPNAKQLGLTSRYPQECYICSKHDICLIYIIER